ncbi:nucleotide exchange factor GrpE [Paenibacillus larvae subsp. pulvifaciens]|uniref:Protein GrpE n=2 Tax=Paenibacillus larvae TaxID=1464 RepID=A0A1V0UPH7_9BACL|nr:nucleotide exchange factor GrpE [Paenibacillus larvae]ARF67179.1 nucleotide exchange factor GrpE [Paenibacillus larvae subsp. pulvifaciens]MCY9511832.1 nucleotide exchange factor GrpE [Paenibacillus larvae]MCY9527573.1 nucleotide exchange factor GrpE [Paenibacillus larvae]QHZ52679.1 molecular chaperone GrpE [Paenibacillus larvae subsp. larvae]
MTNGHQKDNESAQEPVYEKQEQTTDTQVEEPKNDAAESVSESPDSEENACVKELEELREQVKEHQERYLRVQADFDNFRRRSRLEKEDFAKYASIKLIESLLPVIDNFDRALQSSKDTKDFDALAKGIEMVYRQLDQVLTQEGLSPIEAVGEPFNPEFHQAIMQVESEDHEEGIIVEEVQKGYMLKDKVIRPSMVKVSG